MLEKQYGNQRDVSGFFIVMMEKYYSLRPPRVRCALGGMGGFTEKVDR